MHKNAMGERHSNANSDGDAALPLTTMNGRESTVRILLDKGVTGYSSMTESSDVNATDDDGRTVLWIDIITGHEAVVRLLQSAMRTSIRLDILLFA